MREGLKGVTGGEGVGLEREVFCGERFFECNTSYQGSLQQSLKSLFEGRGGRPELPVNER